MSNYESDLRARIEQLWNCDRDGSLSQTLRLLDILLADHRKALVHARNEGIEKVATAFEENDMAATAAEVRAMKEET